MCMYLICKTPSDFIGSQDKIDSSSKIINTLFPTAASELGTCGSNMLPHTCESVHEGGQGSVEHLEERVSAGILLGSTQHRVLQDVWDPRAVHGGRSELNTARQEHA